MIKAGFIPFNNSFVLSQLNPTALGSEYVCFLFYLSKIGKDILQVVCKGLSGEGALSPKK